MDFFDIHCGRIYQREIQKYTRDVQWQKVRMSMKGKSLVEKHAILKSWLIKNDHNRATQVQTTNYINALARGGLTENAKR